MDKDKINELVKNAIENNFNENIISELVFLFFKDDKKTNERIRIGISEEIFYLFMNIAEDFNNNSSKLEENSKEWIENKEMYAKISNLALKLKDAKFKDKIMKIYITKNKSL